MQGNCTSDARTTLNGAPAELKRLFGELSSSAVPLKPFQCLLVTNSNMLFVDDTSGLWVDNFYIRITQPRSQYSLVSASIISTGHFSAEHPSLTDPAKLKSLNIFSTNVTVHGHGLETFPTRVMSLMNTAAKISILCQGPNCMMIFLPEIRSRVACTSHVQASDG